MWYSPPGWRPGIHGYGHDRLAAAVIEPLAVRGPQRVDASSSRNPPPAFVYLWKRADEDLAGGRWIAFETNETGQNEIMFVVDLSQSMEEPLLRGAASPSTASARAISVAAAGGASGGRLAPMLGTPGSRMEAIKRSALDFVRTIVGLYWELYNVTNRNNFGNPFNERTSTLFNELNSVGAPRTMQLGVRYTF